MDQLDEKILMALAGNSRMSIKSLAAPIGLSRPATAARLARLTQSGEIEAFTIRTRQHPHAKHSLLQIQTKEPSCEVLKPWFCEMPEVVQMQSLAGEIDIQLEVVTVREEDLHILRERIASHPAVQSVSVIAVLKTHFSR
jgi:DNA-binding Lrp family transcriptional regulator